MQTSVISVVLNLSVDVVEVLGIATPRFFDQ
jgi:hypothetical protein